MSQLVLAGLSLEELEQRIERGLQTFVEVGLALLEIRDRRLYREAGFTEFDVYCRKRWGWSEAYVTRNIQAAEVAQSLPIGNGLSNEAQARELVQVLRDEGEAALLEVWRDLQQEYPEQALTAERVRNLVQKRLDRVRREEESRPTTYDGPPPPSTVDIRECDFRELKLEPNSVDLLFTDPPYPAKFLDLWYELGEFAARVLKPSAMLVAYTGQFHLPDVLAALESNLTYFWLGSVVTPGAHTMIHARQVRSLAKPVLFFAKDPIHPTHWIDDAYTSEGPDKDAHDWQQSAGAARYYIDVLTEPGALVCDPFLGSGTTAVAAVATHRSFVGCDVDPKAIATAKSRLA